MIKPRIAISTKDDDLMLKQIIARNFETIGVPAAAKSIEHLSSDFSALDLSRKAGIEILYTSSLCDHLLMTDERQLKVFHHASLLRRFREKDAVEKDIYPENLLQETEETLALLFPTADPDAKGPKRTRRIRDKDNVDIEAQFQVPTYYNLDHYKTWKERLMIVQHTYNNSKPRGPRQWWYDRRDPVTRATFWVAVVVFLLTLVFGIISSVTGILQVVLGFRQLHGAPL